LAYALEFFDDASNTWVAYSAGTHPYVSSFSPTTGILVVTTTDYTTYGDTPFVIDTRIGVTSTASETTTN